MDEVTKLSEKIRTSELLREKGLNLLAENDPEKRSEAFDCIIKAYQMGDTEAGFYVGDLMLRGFLGVTEGDREECTGRESGGSFRPAGLGHLLLSEYGCRLPDRD